MDYNPFPRNFFVMNLRRGQSISRLKRLICGPYVNLLGHPPLTQAIRAAAFFRSLSFRLGKAAAKAGESIALQADSLRQPFNDRTANI